MPPKVLLLSSVGWPSVARLAGGPNNASTLVSDRPITAIGGGNAAGFGMGVGADDARAAVLAGADAGGAVTVGTAAPGGPAGDAAGLELHEAATRPSPSVVTPRTSAANIIT